MQTMRLSAKEKDRMGGGMIETAPITEDAVSPVRFLRCLPYTLREEVEWKEPFVWSDVEHNFSNDPGDKGGKTMCGIIQREYDHFRKSRGLPVRDVRLISEWEGHWIYYNWYWAPHSPMLPAGLDLSYFDASVNMGSTEANRILQRTIGVDPDGQWGPKTTAAVAEHSSGAAANWIDAFATERLHVYREMSEFGRFGDDWTSRTARIRRASLGMVNGLPNTGGTPHTAENGEGPANPGRS